MPITYPEFFENLLKNDRSLRAGVDALTVAFDGWLSSSRLPFFTDYTDHGVDHLNRVLATADHLIADSARDLFTPGDAAVLIAATLLHDSALHLSEAGFYSLIRGEAAQWTIQEFPDRPWPILWDEFLFAAKRWDERRLREVLGETPNGELLAHVGDPFTHYHDLGDSDRKLIGEFIRRHHARLAHEFARFGIPGHTRIGLDNTLGTDLRDLAGLVARSHGLPVRSCLDYLQGRYHRREYNGVHAVYLMALLRVSDFLQIQAERAPAIVFQYRHIPSPLSILEWKAHNAIANITQTHDDPESIEIQAHPPDVQTFLRLKEWLAGIQTELDASWTVLGETYGSHRKLSGLGLILRRVRSNLDDVEAFSQHVDYVPDGIELGVARPDLLKLLVGPLYGNDPSIGLRELIQNAVDAVRERQFLQERHPEMRDAPLLEQKHEVEVWLGDIDETGHAWLTVSDRGVGMSVDIVRDYFLTAGASFRNSDAWKREFETDDAPRSRVLRSGRFGVGVLASFLLGPRIEVATRHIRSEFGLRFSVTLDLNPIELRHDPALRVGTVLRLQVPAAVHKQLLEAPARVAVPEKFEWFVYTSPSVARLVGSQRQKLKVTRSIARPTPQDAGALRRVRVTRDYDVYWTYARLPYLSVNGIFVTDGAAHSQFTDSRNVSVKLDNDGFTFEIYHPRVCIEDPDGALPLNLRRSGVTERGYFFEETLRSDIIDDFLAYLLVHCPKSTEQKDWARTTSRHHGAKLLKDISIGRFSFSLHPFAANRAGVMLLSSWLRSAASDEQCRFVMPNSMASFLMPPQHHQGIVSRIERTHYSPDVSPDTPYWAALELIAGIRDSLKDSSKNPMGGPIRILLPSKAKGVRILLPLRIAEKIPDPDRWAQETESLQEKIKHNVRGFTVKNPGELIRRLCTDLAIEETRGKWALVATSGCPKTELCNFDSPGPTASEVCVLEVAYAERQAQALSGPLSVRWQEVFRQDTIPFDLDVRRHQLKHAYEVLEPFVAAHEAMRRQGVLY
jgi:molecular chaperone HtpG